MQMMSTGEGVSLTASTLSSETLHRTLEPDRGERVASTSKQIKEAACGAQACACGNVFERIHVLIVMQTRIVMPGNWVNRNTACQLDVN